MKTHLDKLAAEYGFNLVEKCIENTKKLKELERETNKSLGILIEDGLFAYSIWLDSEGKEIHEAITDSSLKLLKNVGLLKKDTKTLWEGILEEISPNIQKTILARQLIERMLIYARYMAKANAKGE